MSSIRFLAAGAALLLLQMPMAASAQVTNATDVTQLENFMAVNNPSDSLGWTNVPGTSVEGSGISADGSGNLTALSVTYKYSNVSGNFHMQDSAFVTSISLNGNSLTGVSLQDLTALETFSATGNSLTSIGATDFSGLNSLKTLTLNSNSIASIADNAFAGLGSLTSLNLSYNELAAVSASTFNGLTALTTLNLNGNEISTIADDAFSDLGDLTSLDLGSNKLTAIGAGTFNGLTSLKTLNLNYNNTIATINAAAFDDLTELESLNIFRSQLTQIADGTFSNQSKLKTLNLGENQLTAIGTGTFSGLTALTELNLIDNDIATIADNSFSFMSDLTNLNLSNNELTAINAGTFNGLSSLTILNLTNNSIQTLADNAFSDLGALTTLNLGSNNIQSIGTGTFTGLSSLRTLSLIRNEITDIQAGSFSSLGNLQSLDLGQNKLTSLKAGYFDGLSSLTSLYLSENDIASIEKGSFKDLGNLETLFFLNNNLTYLEAGVFEGLDSLDNLGLNGNELVALDAKVFEGLTNLRTLTLESNKLTSIDPGLFNGLINLQDLKLSDNRLTSIDPATFQGLTALKNLSLDNNRLTSIDPMLFDRSTAFGNVYLQGNRLSVSQLSAIQDKLLDVGYGWGNFNNQTEVYFQRRIQTLDGNDSFVVPNEDYIIDGATSSVSYSDDGGSTFTAVGGQQVTFGSTGDYQVRVTNSEAASAKGSSTAANTTTGVISVVNNWSGSSAAAYRPSLGGLSRNGLRLAEAYLPSVAGHLNSGGSFEMEGQDDHSGMFIMSWLDAAGIIDLSSDGTDAIIAEYYNPAIMSALFNQTVPEIHLGAAQGLRLGAAKPFQDNLRTLAISQWPGADFSYGEDEPWRLSFQLQGGRGEMDGDSRQQGYDLDTRGATVSLDYTSYDWRVGAAINFTHLEQDWDRYDGNLKTKAFNAALYGGHRWGDFFLTGQIAGGHGQVDAKRDVPILGAKAEADYDVNWFGADLTGSYQFLVGNTTITPSLGLAWIHTKTDAVREHWSNGDSARLAEESFDSLTARLGVNLAHAFCTDGGVLITPYLNLGANFEMADRQSSLKSTVNSTAFHVPITTTLKGQEVDRFHLDLAAGVEGRLTDRTAISLGYRGDYSGDFQLHQGELTFKVNW